MLMKIDISNNLRDLGIPTGYKLISRDDFLKNGGVGWLRSLKDSTPVLKDKKGKTGSRIWWCYSTSPKTVEAINIDTLETRNCREIPQSMMAILLPA